MSTQTIDFEDTKLITPAELRALLRSLRERADKHAANAVENKDLLEQVRGSALRFAADEIGDLITAALTQAQAEADVLAAKREADKLAEAERVRAATAHAEAVARRQESSQ